MRTFAFSFLSMRRLISPSSVTALVKDSTFFAGTLPRRFYSTIYDLGSRFFFGGRSFFFFLATLFLRLPGLPNSSFRMWFVWCAGLYFPPTLFLRESWHQVPNILFFFPTQTPGFFQPQHFALPSPIRHFVPLCSAHRAPVSRCAIF